MRWLPLLLVALLAGCAQAPADPSSPGAPAAEPGQAGAPAAGSVPVHFAGTAQEADVAFEDTFTPDQWCDVRCSSGDHLHDLTASIPAGVPVHLAATVTGSGEFDAYFSSKGVSYASYSANANAEGVTVEADILRPADGTLNLALMFFQPDGPDPAPKLHSTVTVRSDPARVPPGIPVALTLKPGDVVNATGEGVKGLYLLPPTGPALLDAGAPIGLRVPDGAPAGTYIAIPYGTAAAQLLAPNQTLQPRAYQYHQGATREVAAGQATGWDDAIPDRPVRVGLRLDCKETAPDLGCSGSFRASGKYSVAAPDGGAVYDSASNCSPVCDLTLVAGYFSRSSYGDFLDPHLAPGTYHATADVPQGNAMQAALVWVTIA